MKCLSETGSAIHQEWKKNQSEKPEKNQNQYEDAMIRLIFKIRIWFEINGQTIDRENIAVN